MIFIRLSLEIRLQLSFCVAVVWRTLLTGKFLRTEMRHAGTEKKIKRVIFNLPIVKIEFRFHCSVTDLKSYWIYRALIIYLCRIFNFDDSILLTRYDVISKLITRIKPLCIVNFLRFRLIRSTRKYFLCIEIRIIIAWAIYPFSLLIKIRTFLRVSRSFFNLEVWSITASGDSRFLSGRSWLFNSRHTSRSLIFACVLYTWKILLRVSEIDLLGATSYAVFVPHPHPIEFRHPVLVGEPNYRQTRKAVVWTTKGICGVC